MSTGPTAWQDDVLEGFECDTALHDYTRRELMIPMRDGVRLFTVILAPKNAPAALPIILSRTPYDASAGAKNAASPRMALQSPPVAVPWLPPGYIHAYQDVRGKHRSEGTYTLYRPVRGPLNPDTTDHVTDAWDTIDWLVGNVPGNNGRVGMTGVSYAGFTTLMALLDPHPALRAAVPINPAVDAWIGDDSFHNGAFRQATVEWHYWQEASRDGCLSLPFGHYDTYTAFLEAGSAAELARRCGADRLPAWRRTLENPAYNAYWQEQALDRRLGEVVPRVPTLHVHSLFDQEDIYGAIAAYRVMARQDADGSKVSLFIGPWFHNQVVEDGSSSGAIRWDTDTVRFFRRQVFAPFLDRHLKTAEVADAAERVIAFETGTNAWRRYADWPPHGSTRELYLHAEGRLSADKPGSAAAASEFVSDPAKPVPYRVRPIPAIMPDYLYWSRWLLDDQRPFSARPDVLVFTSEVLEEPLVVRGEVEARLFASTTGADADWVVKVIDVYPDEVPEQPELGGYELMISADIFRGRYRKSFSEPRPIAPGEVLEYRIRLPHANHAFLPGHRIMVQVQSSWFPLYDRNPQTWVENIACASPDDYRAAVHRIHHQRGAASHVLLPGSPEAIGDD